MNRGEWVYYKHQIHHHKPRINIFPTNDYMNTKSYHNVSNDSKSNDNLENKYTHVKY